jgi:hypothetical protein
MDERERRSFGWLGQPPTEVFRAPRWLFERWLKLAKEAERVAMMRFSSRKVELAKRVEARRGEIIAMAREIVRKYDEQSSQ